MPGLSVADLMAQKVKAPPKRLQFAVDGNWMDAWRFEPLARPSLPELGSALGGRGDDVAVEFCFQLPEGDNFFIGLRYGPANSGLDTKTFVDRALGCATNSDWKGLQIFLLNLEAETCSGIGHSASLCVDPENAEVGITDWWRRGEVVEVWSRGTDCVPDQEQIETRLAGRHSLISNTINFVCLELNFRSPMHHWCGVEVSDTVADEHLLNPAKVAHWLTYSLLGSDSVSATCQKSSE